MAVNFAVQDNSRVSKIGVDKQMLGIILDIAKCMAMFSRKCICYVWYDKDTHKVGSLGLQVEGRCTQYCTNAGCKSCNNDLILICWVECRVFFG